MLFSIKINAAGADAIDSCIVFPFKFFKQMKNIIEVNAQVQILSNCWKTVIADYRLTKERRQAECKHKRDQSVLGPAQTKPRQNRRRMQKTHCQCERMGCESVQLAGQSKQFEF